MADWINQYQEFTKTPWSPTTLPPSEEPKFRNWLQKMLKDPTHPTAWKEFFMRQYRVDPDNLGLDTLDKAMNWSKSAGEVESPFYKDPFSSPDYSIK